MLASRRFLSSSYSVSLSLSRKALSRPFSQETSEENSLTTTVVYQSKYGEKIKKLRRISLGSSLFSAFILPVPLFVESSSLPFLAQMALIGTIFLTSVSSTALLAIVTTPYVTRLEELKQVAGSSSARLFTAYRMNIRGKEIPTAFFLEKTDKNATHPFASFSVKDQGNFYIYGGEMADEQLRARLTKE